jgi:hypothetical protein
MTLRLKVNHHGVSRDRIVPIKPVPKPKAKQPRKSKR